MKTFVDTSAFYALADASDRHHSAARKVYEELIGKEELITTDYVLLECWFLISHHLSRNAALKFWDFLLSGAVELVMAERKDLENARKIVAEYGDQDFSLVDAVNFAVMERLGIKKAFTFDAHFHIYRFGREKQERFEVIPISPP
jgi:predicted nucleic acid-binding protein